MTVAAQIVLIAKALPLTKIETPCGVAAIHDGLQGLDILESSLRLFETWQY